MFSIFNGRTSFYQWDVDQKLIINCDIPDYQVHFENTSDEVCYTLEPYEMDGKTVVNVPNLLLQNSTPIIVWCYVLDKNGKYTIKSKTFAVIERQKPSDYVYTETEVLSFNSKLDKNVGAENAGKALIVGEDGNIVFEDTNKNSDAVLYTEQNLTAAQQKQARENIDVAGYNVINYLWPTEHSGREDTDITTLLDSNVYIGIVRNSTAFPSPGLVMLQGPMTGNVYTAVLLAKDGLTYTATFQYVLSTKYINVLDPVAAASSKLISVKLTRSESGENVYTADRDISDIDDALQAGHMALAYMPDAAGLQNSVGLITSCVRTERGSPHFVTVLDCWDNGLASSRWQVGADGRMWTETAYAEYAPSDLVANLDMAMPKPVGKTDAMTQAVGMDETGKLWTQPGASGGGGSDISLGLTGAAVGQIAKITAVDDSGKPTAWEALDRAWKVAETYLLKDMTFPAAISIPQGKDSLLMLSGTDITPDKNTNVNITMGTAAQQSGYSKRWEFTQKMHAHHWGCGMFLELNYVRDGTAHFWMRQTGWEADTHRNQIFEDKPTGEMNRFFYILSVDNAENINKNTTANIILYTRDAL